jgi:hypothetical protein
MTPATALESEGRGSGQVNEREFGDINITFPDRTLE